MTVNYVHEARHRGFTSLFFLFFFYFAREHSCQLRRGVDTHPHAGTGRSRPTLLRERLLKDAFVEAAERRTEVLEVREAQLLVPQLGHGQTVLRLLRRRRGRRRRRLLLLRRRLEAEGLGRRLRVAAHLREMQREIQENGAVTGAERQKKKRKKKKSSMKTPVWGKNTKS